MASVRVAIIGPVCSGKTTTLGHLRDRLAAEGLSVGGVLQPALRRPEGPADYVLEDAETGAQCAFVTRDPATAKPIFDTAGWTWAASRIRGARETRDVVVVDELGIVEARGEGHLPALVEPLASERARLWIVAVRQSSAARLEAHLGAWDLVTPPNPDWDSLLAAIHARLAVPPV
jgi:nucleoside-triphosphatase THEP1